jgi:transposase
MTAVAQREPTTAELLERITALERENQILREENALLRQWRFGRSSERIEPGQLGLFGATGAPLPEPPQAVEVPAHARAKPGHGRTPFPEHLPRVTIGYDVPEAERVCGSGRRMQPIGADESERGHIVPARIVVNRYVRKKYACPAGHGVVTAKAPEGVIEGAKYEASVYAYVATAKYCDHQPLHRLEGIFKRQGVELPKQTMWGMLVTVDELLAQPVLRQMRAELLEEPVLLADETPVTMKVEDERKSCETYAWCWRGLGAPDAPKVLVEFRPSRARDGPTQFLGDWCGTLLTDGYTGYDEIVARNGIVRAGCWSHARRKLKEAFDTGTAEAALLLAPIQRLFWIERAIEQRAERDGLAVEARRELCARVRGQRSRRVVERIHSIATELALRRATLPKSKLGKALTYLDRQREPLAVFLGEPRIPIHNNDTERDIRHLALGRNNWNIFASPRGGEVACRLYSLVISCRHAGVDPQQYLEDALGKVSTTPASQIATLTPWGWARARAQGSTPTR